MPTIWCYIQAIQTVQILSQNEFLFCSEFSEYVCPFCQILILKRGKHFQVSYDSFRLLFLSPLLFHSYLTKVGKLLLKLLQRMLYPYN